jgi:hypothetical protein
MLFSVGEISKHSLTKYDGPVVKTVDEWLALSNADRGLFAGQMDIIGPLNEFLWQRAHSQRTEIEESFCYHCGGKGRIIRKPRGVGIFSPSGLTRCARETYFQFIGERGKQRNDVTSQKTFDVGTAVHEYYQERYFYPMFPGPPETPVQFTAEVKSSLSEIDLKGHADGEFEGERFRVGLEIKTMSASQFAKLTKPSWDYVVQNTAYNRMNDWPGSIFLFIEKDYPHNYTQFFLGFDPAIFEWLEHKLRKLEEAAEAGEPPAPTVDTNWACKRCKYYDICRYGGGEV